MMMELKNSSSDVPFKYIGGDPAIDLVNTVDWTSRGMEQERLTDYARLIEWAKGAGLISGPTAATLRERGEARPREAEAALRLASALAKYWPESFVQWLGESRMAMR